MTAEAPLQFRTKVRERLDRPRLRFRSTVTTEANDTLPFDYTIEPHDFFGDSWRQLGVSIVCDRGDGVLSQLTASEMPGQITLTGSLAGFGVRELTFGRIGSQQSPLRSAALRGARGVKMSGFRGTLGGIREWPLFDGYLRDPGFAQFPPASTITAQDASVLSRPLFYTLAPRSARTRISVVEEIAGLYQVPLGTIAFEDEDGVGGIVLKEINEGGDRAVLAFFNEFLTPTGCRAYWRDGKLHIRRFDTTGTPVRSLSWSDIRSISIAPPSTTTPNRVRLATEMYPEGLDVTLNGTVVEVADTPGPYTPVAATHQLIDGVLEPVTPDVAEEPLLSRVITTTEYQLGTILSRTVEEYEWYSPKMCTATQATDGSAEPLMTAPYPYLYPDGTYRWLPTELFILVRRSRLTRTFEAGVLSAETLTRERFSNEPKPLQWYEHILATTRYLAETESFGTVFLTPDGAGWVLPYEMFGRVSSGILAPAGGWGYESLSRTFTANEDGTIVSYLTESSRWRVRLSTLGVDPAVDSLIFGAIPSNVDDEVEMYGASELFASLEVRTIPLADYLTHYFGHYGAASSELEESWTASFTPLSATEYRVIRAPLLLGAGPLIHTQGLPSIADAEFLDGTVGPAGVEDVTDDLPVLEELVTSPQPGAVILTDRVRLRLTGRALVDAIENGWCENEPEAIVAARERLRELGAIPVGLETDVDFSMCEGEVITLPPHPDLGVGPTNVLIHSVTWSLSPQGSSQSMECWFLPPELYDTVA